MHHIVIISSSIRVKRNSHRVALYFNNYITENNLATSEVLDLNEYQFPIFDERLKHQVNPTEKVLDFANKIKNANGVIIVTPEYNGGYPSALKNAIDLLYEEWYRKPIAIATVSDGMFGGSQVVTSLEFVFWKMKAMLTPATFPVPKVDKSFDEMGVAVDKAGVDKRAAIFMSELLWSIEAVKR